jgi:hypothetical protein
MAKTAVGVAVTVGVGVNHRIEFEAAPTSGLAGLLQAARTSQLQIRINFCPRRLNCHLGEVAAFRLIIPDFEIYVTLKIFIFWPWLAFWRFINLALQ